jgi:hypothetical protein
MQHKFVPVQDLNQSIEGAEFVWVSEYQTRQGVICLFIIYLMLLKHIQ